MTVQSEETMPNPELKESLKDTLLYKGTRKMIMIGLGAAVILKEEGEELLDKLAERGEEAAKEQRDFGDTMADKRKKQTQKAKERLNSMLDRLNIPTRSDIDALNAKIEELSRKIDALR